MAWSNLETLTSLKLPRKDWCTLRLEPLITRAQRFGWISLMTTDQIFGAWVAYFMKWLLWCHHSELQAWLVWAKKLQEEFTTQFQSISHLISKTLSRLVFKLNLRTDLNAIKFSQLQAYLTTWQEHLKSLIFKRAKMTNQWTCWPLLGAQETSVKSLTDCHNLSTSQEGLKGHNPWPLSQSRRSKPRSHPIKLPNLSRILSQRSYNPNRNKKGGL